MSQPRHQRPWQLARSALRCLVLFGLVLDEGMTLLLPVGQLHHDGRNVGEADILELPGRQRSAAASRALHVYLAVHLNLTGVTELLPNPELQAPAGNIDRTG